MKKKQKTFAILTGVIVILLLAFFGMYVFDELD